ncbi:hypothetical protein HZC31_02520 [Candidatus Woesearchaeota archaeon]|nr:hypothetical protein [Candidatus Woesearchaeota archaeon]
MVKSCIGVKKAEYIGNGLPESVNDLVGVITQLNHNQVAVRQRMVRDVTKMDFYFSLNPVTVPVNCVKFGKVQLGSRGCTYEGLFPIPAVENHFYRVRIYFDNQGRRESSAVFTDFEEDLDALVKYDTRITDDLKKSLNGTFHALSVKYHGQQTKYMGPVDKLGLYASGIQIGHLYVGEQRSVGSYVGITWQPRCLMTDASKPADVQGNDRFRVTAEAEKFRLHQAGFGEYLVPERKGLAYRGLV